MMITPDALQRAIDHAQQAHDTLEMLPYDDEGIGVPTTAAGLLVFLRLLVTATTAQAHAALAQADATVAALSDDHKTVGVAQFGCVRMGVVHEAHMFVSDHSTGTWSWCRGEG